MEIFYTDNSFKLLGHSAPQIPFVVNDEMELVQPLNQFLYFISAVNGKTRSPKTWSSYADRLIDFFRWLSVNEITWHQASKSDIAIYRDWSLNECGCAISTVNDKLSAIRSFYNYHREKGNVVENPIGKIKKTATLNADADFLAHTRNNKDIDGWDLTIKENSELPKVFSKGEIEALLSGTKNVRLKLMMNLMLQCGLRREEVCSLPLTLIEDLELQALKQGPDAELSLELPAYICKNNKPRTIPITYHLVMKLRHYRVTERNRLAKKYKALNNSTPTEFWLNQRGTAISINGLSGQISELGKRVGISANPHKFRHTFGTELYAISGDLRLVQKLMGHSHITTTEIYEHTLGADKRGFLEEYQTDIDKVFMEGE